MTKQFKTLRFNNWKEQESVICLTTMQVVLIEVAKVLEWYLSYCVMLLKYMIQGWIRWKHSQSSECLECCDTSYMLQYMQIFCFLCSVSVGCIIVFVSQIWLISAWLALTTGQRSTFVVCIYCVTKEKYSSNARDKVVRRKLRSCMIMITWTKRVVLHEKLARHNGNW